jgi:hypothetical protein
MEQLETRVVTTMYAGCMYLNRVIVKVPKSQQYYRSLNSQLYKGKPWLIIVVIVTRKQSALVFMYNVR